MTTPDLLPQAGPACAAPGCRRAPIRGRLCGHHADKLGQTLTDLAGDLTDADLAPPLIGWRTGGHGSTLASERDPINLAMLAATGAAPPVLAAWAEWLCQQRPNLTRHGGAVADRKLLAAELPWIIRQPEVTDFWVQIRSLWSHIRGHLPVRRCTCGGPVWADPGGGWCSWCAAPWGGAALLALPRPNAA